jgi:hypothetical protein
MVAASTELEHGGSLVHRGTGGLGCVYDSGSCHGTGRRESNLVTATSRLEQRP